VIDQNPLNPTDAPLRFRPVAAKELSVPRIHTLFVCARNQWRSPTAERIFRDDSRFSVRSRGLSPQSPRQITLTDVAWADRIFVMETKHRTRLVERFQEALHEKPIHVLDIPDDYPFMDPELIELLRERVEWHFRGPDDRP
jgi:predicted protein tyrosine phosphatase